MYFASREQAGRILASKMVSTYKHKNCTVVALDDGGVIVGAQVSVRLHCALTLLTSAEIHLPLELAAVAGITGEGSLAYNNQYSQGELDELLSENRGFIEQEKLHQMHELNHVLSGRETIDKRLLKNRNVILVSDGLKTAFELDLAYEFLKPIALEKLVFATPLASVAAVDRMHVMGDDLYCLNVVEEYSNTDHYYDKQDVPSHDKVLEIVENVVHKWKQAT